MTQQNNTIAPVGRILIAVLSLASGIGKLAAPAARQGYIAAMGLPAPVAASLASMAGRN
jgi:putative oxidoreductase